MNREHRTDRLEPVTGLCRRDLWTDALHLSYSRKRAYVTRATYDAPDVRNERCMWTSVALGHHTRGVAVQAVSLPAMWPTVDSAGTGCRRRTGSQCCGITSTIGPRHGEPRLDRCATRAYTDGELTSASLKNGAGDGIQGSIVYGGRTCGCSAAPVRLGGVYGARGTRNWQGADLRWPRLWSTPCLRGVDVRHTEGPPATGQAESFDDDS